MSKPLLTVEVRAPGQVRIGGAKLLGNGLEAVLTPVDRDVGP